METTDCVVIGAGVVGLACARSLADAGRDVIVVRGRDGRAAGHGNCSCHAPAGSELAAQHARNGATLDQPRHLFEHHAAGLEQRLGPSACPGIQPGRAGRVRHLRHMLAGQP